MTWITLLVLLLLVLAIAAAVTVVVVAATRSATGGQTNNPNLRPCPDCGQYVSVRAITCPHCGAPVKGA
jgi:hypothetical protein